MTLDLNELVSGWEQEPGDLAARIIVGRDGAEHIQLRVDMGVMQMTMAGRPDGKRHRNEPSAYEFITRDSCTGGYATTMVEWQELEREIHQHNYRRLAYATLAEDALRENRRANAEQCIAGAVRDIDECLLRLDSCRRHSIYTALEVGLRPTLIFNRGRQLSQLRVVQGRYEEAIEAAEEALQELDALLEEYGLNDEGREADPGIVFLRELGQRLRREYGIPLTLSEQLERAIEREDFETAARLRDELRRRGQRRAS